MKIYDLDKNQNELYGGKWVSLADHERVLKEKDAEIKELRQIAQKYKRELHKMRTGGENE
jgi:hypothetical protein